MMVLRMTQLGDTFSARCDILSHKANMLGEAVSKQTPTDTMMCEANLAHLTSRRLAAAYNFSNEPNLIIVKPITHC